jgi:hypothetical protein
MRSPTVSAHRRPAATNNPRVRIQCHHKAMRFPVIFTALMFLPRLVAIEVKNAPSDYPAQGAVEDFKLGAEYMVSSFSAQGESFTVDRYLIVEVGVFPQGEAKIDLSRFTLRINGKTSLMTQTPGMVAASVKYPDWTSKPEITAAAGPILIGRPPAVERFPGDRRNQRGIPGQVIETQEPKVDYGRLIETAALPEGKRNKPIAGFLYFPYDKKLKSIRTVDLLVDDKVIKVR